MRVEETQEGIYQIQVLPGVSLDFEGLPEAPCEVCGGMVRLDSLITVRIADVDGGNETEQLMTEADARQLLAEAGIPLPPVMCDRHEQYMITTERDRP